MVGDWLATHQLPLPFDDGRSRRAGCGPWLIDSLWAASVRGPIGWGFLHPATAAQWAPMAWPCGDCASDPNGWWGSGRVPAFVPLIEAGNSMSPPQRKPPTGFQALAERPGLEALCEAWYHYPLLEEVLAVTAPRRRSPWWTSGGHLGAAMALFSSKPPRFRPVRARTPPQQD